MCLVTHLLNLAFARNRLWYSVILNLIFLQYFLLDESISLSPILILVLVLFFVNCDSNIECLGFPLLVGQEKL